MTSGWWVAAAMAGLAACSSTQASIIDGTWSTTRELTGSGGCDPDPQGTAAYSLVIGSNASEVEAETVTWVGSAMVPASNVMPADGCFAQAQGNCALAFDTPEHWVGSAGDVADFQVSYTLSLSPADATTPPRDFEGTAAATFDDAAGHCEIAWTIVAQQL